MVSLPLKFKLIIFPLFFICISTFSNKLLVLNQVEGVSGTKLLKEAYKKLGIKLDIRIQPAARGLSNANLGTIDGEVNRIDGINTQFKNLIKIDVPILLLDIVAVSHTKNLQINNWQDLKSYNIGTLKGLKIAELNLDKVAKYKSISKFENLFNMLNLKRFDVIIAPLLDTLEHIKLKNMNSLIVYEKPLSQIKLYHYLNKKHSNLVPQITKILKEMATDKSIKKYNKSLTDSYRNKI